MTEIIKPCQKWKIIYNDGHTITTADSQKYSWDEAPSEYVQYLLLYDDGHRKVINGIDEYELSEHSSKKTGFLLSSEEWKRTKNFMIYDK